jgi:hypothetical protein
MGATVAMPCSTLETEEHMHKTLAPLIAAGVLALAAAPASADGPAGGCPAPYTLTAISDLPPVGQPGAITIDQRGNHDGYVCLMPFPGNAANAIGAPFNAIDNRVQS